MKNLFAFILRLLTGFPPPPKYMIGQHVYDKRFPGCAPIISHYRYAPNGAVIAYRVIGFNYDYLEDELLSDEEYYCS